MATVKDLEAQVIELTNTVKALSDNIVNLNNTSNKKLDESLKLKCDSFNLEGAVRTEMLRSVGGAVTSYLHHHSSKNIIEPIIVECFNTNKDLIRKNISKAIQDEFDHISVSSLLREHFRAKLAKAIIGNIESLVTVSIAQLRKDVTFNSELVIAVDRFIQEYKDSNNK